MRILLDENIPVDFAAELPGHDISTVVGLGWSGVLNGELLKRARGRCEVFVTLDRNIEFQQNIPALPFAVCRPDYFQPYDTFTAAGTSGSGGGQSSQARPIVAGRRLTSPQSRRLD